MNNYIDPQVVRDQINGILADNDFTEQDAYFLVNWLLSKGTLSGNPRDLIQIRRGLQEDLPNLAQGELAVTLDTKKLYVGGPDGNIDLTDTTGFIGVIDHLGIDVTTVGIKGDNSSDSNGLNSDALQTLLDTSLTNGGLKIRFPKGKYRFSKRIRVHKNTVIEIDSEAEIIRDGNQTIMFINGEHGNTTYASGYNGDGNIHFTGLGTINVNSQQYPPASTLDYGCTAIAFAHGDNISFTGITFINGQNNHYCDIAGCSNVTFKNVNFLNLTVTGNNAYEAIQINATTAASFSAFGSYDRTICTGVTIESCYFENGYSALGDHSLVYDVDSSVLYHNNISIINNTIKGQKESALQPYGWNDFLITGNLIDSLKSGIAGVSCKSGQIVNNTVNGGSQGITMFTSGVVLPENIIFMGNIIKEVLTNGMNLNGKSLDVTSNKIINPGTNGMTLNGLTDSVIENNTIESSSYITNNTASGINCISTTGIIIKGNSIYSLIANKPTFGINDRSTCLNTTIVDNNIRDYHEKDIANVSIEPRIGISFKELMLTPLINVSAGTIPLSDSVTKFSHLIIAVGSVEEGTLEHYNVRSYFKNKFRVGVDTIRFDTGLGETSLTITNASTLTVVETSIPIRYIIGVL